MFVGQRMLESMIIMPDQTAEQVCMVEIEYAMVYARYRDSDH